MTAQQALNLIEKHRVMMKSTPLSRLLAKKENYVPATDAEEEQNRVWHAEHEELRKEFASAAQAVATATARRGDTRLSQRILVLADELFGHPRRYGHKGILDEFILKLQAAALAVLGDDQRSERIDKTLEELGDEHESEDIEPLVVVTLLQAAALAGLSKRTLERHLKSGQLPKPDIKGGGGKSNKWYWKNLKPELDKVCDRILPIKFPGSRIRDAS